MFHTLRIMDYEANKVVEIVETNELLGDFTYFWFSTLLGEIIQLD